MQKDADKRVTVGELESTFLRTSARCANLWAILFDDEDVRRTVVELVSTFKSLENEDARGFRRASLLDPNLSEDMLKTKTKRLELEDEQYHLLSNLLQHDVAAHTPLPRQVLSMAEISFRGVSYATVGSSRRRDSAIIFQLPASDRSWNEDTMHKQKAGVVKAIFQHAYRTLEGTERKGFYLFVQEYPRIDSSDDRVDPYCKFGFAGGFLCAGQATQHHVIALSQVVSHFALTEMRTAEEDDHDESLILAFPVNRVRLLLLSLLSMLILFQLMLPPEEDGSGDDHSG